MRLRKVVAEFFSVDESEVGPAFRLAGPRGFSSISRAALDAAIRRGAGVRSPTIHTATTFGELTSDFGPAEAALPAARTVATAITSDASAQPLGCGVDMELVENLPRAVDCWADPFYLATFSPAEIAYCLVQPEPAPHFCARWCAKEALKKCDPSFQSSALKDLEVAHEATGAPYLVDRADGGSRRLTHAVSLSHTPLAAIAMVVRADAAPVPAPVPPREIAAAAPPALGSRGAWQAVLTVLALGLSVLALYRTFVSGP